MVFLLVQQRALVDKREQELELVGPPDGEAPRRGSGAVSDIELIGVPVSNDLAPGAGVE
jgi:hypothetical protein